MEQLIRFLSGAQRNMTVGTSFFLEFMKLLGTAIAFFLANRLLLNLTERKDQRADARKDIRELHRERLKLLGEIMAKTYEAKSCLDDCARAIFAAYNLEKKTVSKTGWEKLRADLDSFDEAGRAMIGLAEQYGAVPDNFFTGEGRSKRLSDLIADYIDDVGVLLHAPEMAAQGLSVGIPTVVGICTGSVTGLRYDIRALADAERTILTSSASRTLTVVEQRSLTLLDQDHPVLRMLQEHQADGSEQLLKGEVEALVKVPIPKTDWKYI
jgi:hypothetical protein